MILDLRMHFDLPWLIGGELSGRPNSQTSIDEFWDAFMDNGP